jgi:hypothetical protein
MPLHVAAVSFDMAVTMSDALDRGGSAQRGSEARQTHSRDDGVHHRMQAGSEARSRPSPESVEGATRMLPSRIKLRLRQQPFRLQSMPQPM